MAYIQVIQYVETAKNEAEASQMLAGLKLQDGFRCGRILAETPSKPLRVQSFFHDCPELTNAEIEHQDGHSRRFASESWLDALQ